MITIEITEETNTVQDMVYCLNEIVRLLESGSIRGFGPDFSISGEEEPEDVE